MHLYIIHPQPALPPPNHCLELRNYFCSIKERIDRPNKQNLHNFDRPHQQSTTPTALCQRLHHTHPRSAAGAIYERFTHLLLRECLAQPLQLNKRLGKYTQHFIDVLVRLFGGAQFLYLNTTSE